MKKLAPYFAAMILAAQAIGACAQTSGRPEPGFTLTLSEGHRGSTVAYQQVLVVKLTNISKEVMHRTMCDSFGGLYNLEVVYNGVPVEKTDAELKWKKQHEAGECYNGSAVPEQTKPGESRYDTLYYNTIKPGTYEITVTGETFPGEPEKSVTVKSNTLTIVVPEPRVDATQ
jgi:hypothetical protein